MKNIEIEVKYQVKSFAKIKQFLSKNAKFIKTVKQKDVYYNPAHRILISAERTETLRIRWNHDNSATLTYKKDMDDSKTVRKEINIEIKNPEDLQKILKALDFKEAVVVDKVREIYEYEDLEIVLDKVANLGEFIEIEYKGKLADVKQIFAQIDDFATKLGLDASTKQRYGYAILMLKKIAI